jgi:protein TonB
LALVSWLPEREARGARAIGRAWRRTRLLGVVVSVAIHWALFLALLSQTPSNISGPLDTMSQAPDRGSAVQISLVRMPMAPAVAPPDKPRVSHAAALDNPLSRPSKPGVPPVRAAAGDRPPAQPGGRAIASSAADARTAPDVAATAAVQAGIGSDFEQRLFDHIEHFLIYPAAAPDSRPHAVAQILFRMDRSGRVLGVWLRQSSGFPAFDSAAVAAVWRAQPLPPIPAELPDDLNVTAPVEFTPPALQAAG